MADYEINFKDLKGRVGIDDVAYSLGYRLNRKAGVGRYIELVLGQGDNKRDTLIVSNPNNKAAQTFFRRNGSKGDVVTLIRENLSSFNVSAKDEWHQVAMVMAKFANMPDPVFKKDRDYIQKSAVSREFDSSRYEAIPISPDRIPAVFSHRGISDETVKELAPFISLVKDKNNDKVERYNVGFPYTDGIEDKVKGYELRGYGSFKSKAYGTDSSKSSWVADLSGGNNLAVKNVFLCESAFDAMAFYQMNRARLDKNIALVSFGGTFSDGQVKNVMNRFPNARLFECLDNDLPGRMSSIRIMALLEGVPINIHKTPDKLVIESGKKTFSLATDKSLIAQVAKQLNLRYTLGQWPPPAKFKDWNDCLLNKPMQIQIAPNKVDREQNLLKQRTAEIKI